MTFQQIRNSFSLHIQTFLQLNQQYLKYNHNIAQFNKYLEDCKIKILSRQFLVLLKTIIVYSMDKSYRVDKLSLCLDNNSDLSQILLQKCLIIQILKDKNRQQIQNIYLKSITLIVDLVWELYEIKKGNTKYYFNITPTNQNDKHLELQTNNHQDRLTIVQEAQFQIIRLQRIDHKGQKHSYCTFSLQIIQKYRFVIFSKNQKIKLINTQMFPENSKHFIENINIQVETSKNKSIINNFYIYLSKYKQKQQFIFALIMNLLKNLQSIDEKQINCINNTIVLLLEEMNETQINVDTNQLIQIKGNLFLYVLILKILYAIIKNNKKVLINWTQLINNIHESFQQIMEYFICNIKQSWWLLLAFSCMPLQNYQVYQKMIQMFNWTIQLYFKHQIKNEDFGYAQYIIFLKEVISSWNYNVLIGTNQYPDQKVSQQQNKAIIDKLIQIQKKYGQSIFETIFTTFNIKLLHYLHILFLLYNIKSSNNIKKQNKSIFIKFYEVISHSDIIQSLACFKKQFYNLFLSGNVQNSIYVSEIEQNKLFIIIKTILFQRLIVKKQLKEEIKIYIFIDKIQRFIQQNNSAVNFIQNLQLLINKCLIECLELIKIKANFILIENTNISNKKNTQRNNIFTQNADLVTADIFLESVYVIVTYLCLLKFAIDPVKNNYEYFLRSIIFNSYSSRQIEEDKFIQILNFAGDLQINWNQYEIYAPHLKYSPRYEVLQFFYEKLLIKKEQTQQQKNTTKHKFEQLCNDWCLNENNYEWLSEQKSFKIHLISIKNYSENFQAAIKNRQSD